MPARAPRLCPIVPKLLAPVMQPQAHLGCQLLIDGVVCSQAVQSPCGSFCMRPMGAILDQRCQQRDGALQRQQQQWVILSILQYISGLSPGLPMEACFRAWKACFLSAMEPAGMLPSVNMPPPSRHEAVLLKRSGSSAG